MRTQQDMQSMTCPVDGTVLVMSDRQGIEIDYCPACRGVWLDRGELDKIIERSAPQASGSFGGAATGIAVAFALFRGFARREASSIGNFWADITRVTLYLLLPICLVYALFLIASGVPQTFHSSIDATTLEGAKQTIVLGPVAGQEAIKMLGTNGGGFFNANSAHGVLSTTGIQTHAYATDLFTSNAEAIALADIANVATARRAFLTSNTVKKIGSLELDANKLPVGIPAIFHNEAVTFSNQVPTNLGAGTEHALIYGDWSELLIGVWSEIDILVNPFESTAYSKGNVSIRAMASVDSAVRHPKAFVSITGVTDAAVGIA